MIEDRELATLFQAESEEYLQTLDEGLLHLESGARDTGTLERVFRAAHSLKGTARMLGVTDVESIAHRFEDELGAARRTPGALSPASIDRMCGALDAMRALVREAISGQASGVDVPAVLSRLNPDADGEVATEYPLAERTPAERAVAAPDEEAAVPQEEETLPQTAPQHEVTVAKPEIAAPPATSPAASSQKSALPNDDVTPQQETVASPRAAPSEVATALVPIASVASIAPVVPVADSPIAVASSPAPLSAPSAAPFQIETMRVEPARLDALTTLSGELIVTTTRLGRGLSEEAEQLAELVKEWSKDAVSGRLPPSPEEWSRFQERDAERVEQAGAIAERLRHTSDEDATHLRAVANELAESVRNVRLLPMSTVFNLFGRMVRDLAHEQNKEVRLVVEGGETTADKRVLEELKDPLMHIVRNAVDHGIETPAERQSRGKPPVATLTLRAERTSTSVQVEVRDDGRGLDIEAIRRVALARRVAREDELQNMAPEDVQRLIFAPGFSTNALVTDVSGRGVGLDVAMANVERLKGTVTVESRAGEGCTFRLRLPITLATTRVLLACIDGHTYAIPVEWVQSMLLVRPDEVFCVKGRDAICVQGRPVSVTRASELLEVREASGARCDPSRDGTNTRAAGPWYCVILEVGEERLGVFVDELLDEQEVILKPLGGLLSRVRNVAGATILGTGEACMVLHPVDLIKSARQMSPSGAATLNISAGDEAESEAAARQKVILLADDSITTRTQEKRILEGAGYEVVVAVDGLDAWGKLSTRAFDAVVSDVQMPHMDGLTLTARIRADARYHDVAIILVTSLASDEDRRRGAEAGANAYITKGTFDQKTLLGALGRLA